MVHEYSPYLEQELLFSTNLLDPRASGGAAWAWQNGCPWDQTACLEAAHDVASEAWIRAATTYKHCGQTQQLAPDVDGDVVCGVCCRVLFSRADDSFMNYRM